MCVCVCVCVCVSLAQMERFVVLVAQSCLTLCNPMDCSPSVSSVQGTLQGRILKWVAIPSSRESSWLREVSGSHICLFPDSVSPALLADSSLSEPPGYWVRFKLSHQAFPESVSLDSLSITRIWTAPYQQTNRFPLLSSWIVNRDLIFCCTLPFT